MGGLDLRILQQTPTREKLNHYGSLSIAFTVDSQLVVRPIEEGIGGLALVEEPIAVPYVKDYDAVKDEGPTRWQNHFDLSHWVILTAHEGEQQVGGLVLAWRTHGVDMLEGRGDLAVIWDVRVSPRIAVGGVGNRLFVAAEEWAKAHGCCEIKVETQNINVPACRFYARQGCVLRTIRQNAYPDLPDEVQLLWYKKW